MNREDVARAQAYLEEVKQRLKQDSVIYKHVFSYPGHMMTYTMAKVLIAGLPISLLFPVLFYSDYKFDLVDFLSFWLGSYIFCLVVAMILNVTAYQMLPNWAFLVTTHNYVLYTQLRDKNADVIAEIIRQPPITTRFYEVCKIEAIRKDRRALIRVLGRKDLISLVIRSEGLDGVTRDAEGLLVPSEAMPGFVKSLRGLNPGIKVDPALESSMTELTG